MAKGNCTPITEQEKEAPKRTWARGPRKRTLRSKLWDYTGLRGKTGWDWLELVIVPLVLVVIGSLFTAQDARQQQIESQRAKAGRELAEQRAQDEVLQTYFDQMSSLLLEKDLRASEEKSEVRTIARARTLSVLERVDPSRKADIIRFLEEANLVQSVGGRDPVVRLSDADLSDTQLNNIGLTGADLGNADLSGANLSNAALIEADLRGANLRGATLSDANLSDANLSDANLSDANLSGANLSGADLSGAKGVTKEQLEEQTDLIDDAIMPDGSKHP